MTLSIEAIREFQTLHERIFGIKPSEEEAEQDLLKLMRIISLTQPKTEPTKTEVKA